MTTENNKKFNSKKRTNTQQQPQEPVITKESVTILDYFKYQIEDFLGYVTYEGDDFRDRNRALFSTEERPSVMDDSPNLELYILQRTIRTDRDTGDLQKASCSALVWDADATTPAYFVSCYINAAGNASINVIPQGKYGPDRRNTNRWSNAPVTPKKDTTPEYASNHTGEPKYETKD